jgi:hypothetical protein
MKEISADHHLRASHQDLILHADVRICLLEVALQAARELRVKHEMALIRVVRVLHRWIVINLVCAHEFLNQISLKMLLVKS